MMIFKDNKYVFALDTLSIDANLRYLRIIDQG